MHIICSSGRAKGPDSFASLGCPLSVEPQLATSLGSFRRFQQSGCFSAAIKLASPGNLQSRWNTRSSDISYRTPASTSMDPGHSASSGTKGSGLDAQKNWTRPNENHSVLFHFSRALLFSPRPRTTIDLSLRRFAYCSTCVRTAGACFFAFSTHGTSRIAACVFIIPNAI